MCRAPGRRHALPGEELEGHHSVDRGPGPLEAAQEQVYPLPGQLLGVLADRSEEHTSELQSQR